jgi:uncharacterized membrane-anchored protein
MRSYFAAAFLVVFSLSGAEARTFKEMFGEVPIEDAQLKAKLEGINYQQGDIRLPVAGLTIHTGKEFYYLDAKDTKTVAVDFWGNPPGVVTGALGMIFPAKYIPAENVAWGSLITYQDEGHINDSDASKLNYDDLLRDMKAATEENNAERKRQGYKTLTLVGWASPPFYDQVNHRLHWARDLVGEGSDTHSLNYSVRLLGRTGTLSMNFVSDLGQLDEIKAAIPDVMTLATFGADQSYSDYRDGDKVAAYGIAGLIAAGAGVKLAAKAGLIAIGLAFLKKGWIVVVLFGSAILGWIRKLFGKRAN